MLRSHRSGADGVVRPATSCHRTSIEASPYRARASRPARQLLLSCRATLLCEGNNILDESRPVGGNFEIGQILHLKSEISKYQIGPRLFIGPICDFGFRI